MKIPAIRAYNLNKKSYIVKSDTQDGFDIKQEIKNINDLSVLPCYYPINFTSCSGSGGLRSLVQYGLPCMYSGITMLDPARISKQMKNGYFSKPSHEVIKTFENYEQSLTDNEKEVYEIIKERAKTHPEMTISEIVKEITPVYRKKLRSEQMPIFYDLITMSAEMPENQRIQFKLLMNTTFKRLEDKPAHLKFSASEFKYKLAKIREDILLDGNNKHKKIINKVFKESKRIPSSKKIGVKEEQIKIINNIENILKNSSLADNEQLTELIGISKQKLNEEKVMQSFSRKTFLYDLCRILEQIPDENLQKRMIEKAQELPTSSNNINAYIMKISSESSDKICFRLLWPSIATVEHIHPRSELGPNSLSNYGLACARANSERKSRNLRKWFEERPERIQNCQNYADRLIELYKQRKFPHNLSPKYIVDFKTAIYKESEGMVSLDISALYH